MEGTLACDEWRNLDRRHKRLKVEGRTYPVELSALHHYLACLVLLVFAAHVHFVPMDARVT